MITSIQLTNWRSHESSRLEFSKGTNIIIGIMGSGKSSVMDALCFALFGNFPALQHRKLKISDIIRARPSQEKNAKVELEFEINRVRYSVSRTINLEGATGAEIRKDGKLLEAQPKRVNDLIESLLSIDYDLFTRAIYSEQNNIDYFLALARGDRKKQIDQLLGIDRFETVRSELVKTINRLKDIKAEKASLIKGADRGRAEQELAQSKKEKEKLSEELNSVTFSLDQFASKRKALEVETAVFESARSSHKRLSERKAGLSHTIESSCRQLGCRPEELDEDSISKDSDSARVKIKGAKEELQSVEHSLGQLQSAVATEKSRLKEFEEKSTRRAKLEADLNQLLAGKKLHDLETDLSSSAQAVNSKVEEIGRMRAQIADGLEANTELEKGEGKCPVCEAALTEERKRELLEKRNAELANMGSQVKVLEKEFASKSSELRHKQDALSKANALEAKLSEIAITGKKAEIISSISRDEGQKVKLENRIKEMRDSVSSYEESLRSAESKLRLVSLVKELAEAEKSLFASKFDEKSYEKARGELEGARVSEREARTRKEGLEREDGRIDETIKLQAEKLAQLESYSKSISHIDSNISQFSIFQNCVADTQRELREELITAINSTMTDVWGSLYPYADYKEIRLKADDKGYELEARAGENWISVDGIASGGERASACLALRIAFAMVLAPNLNWLILDEPTHNLDEEAVRSLASALYEKIPEIVEQTFVITHDENLKDAASGSLYKINRNKNENEPSKAEKL
jgi:exonuclease SbcC